MNLNNLINLLTEFQKAGLGETPICVDGYEGGVTEVFTVSTCSVLSNKNTLSCYGEHEPFYYDYKISDEEIKTLKTVICFSQ